MVYRGVGKPCPWCNRMMAVNGDLRATPTRDHLMPRARLAPARRAVIVIVCDGCNSSKKAMTIDEWLAVLIAGNDGRAPIVSAWITKHHRMVDHARSLDIGHQIPTLVPPERPSTLADVWPR